jgi:hypothetical protein
MPLIPAFFTVLAAFVPLPMPFLTALKEIHVETSTDSAAVFRLQFDLSQTTLGDWDVLQFDIFRPLVPVQVRISLGIGLSETVINGYVREARLSNRNEPGQSTLKVTGMDATGTLMNHIEMSLPRFGPDNAIASMIFGQYGITPIAMPTPSVRVPVQTTTIQRGTDIRFLKRLARRYGYECYVQPDPLIGTDFGYFGPPKIMMPPQGVLSVNFGISTNMQNFHVSYDMLRPTSALAVAIDPSTKVPTPGIAPAALEPPMGLEPSLLRILLPPIVRPAGTDAANPAELVATAQGIVNRSSRCIRGTGEVDGLKFGHVMRPGLPVLVRGAGREHSGLYYVTQVSHTISREGYSQTFQAWRNAVGLTGAEIFIDPMAALA